MNMLQMMGAVSNPQQYIMQQAMQGMIGAHPSQWKQAQGIFNGKSHDEQLDMLRELYSKTGMDLDTTARQWGIQI